MHFELEIVMYLMYPRQKNSKRNKRMIYSCGNTYDDMKIV